MHTRTNSILNKLPVSLRTTMIHHLIGDYVRHSPLFRGCAAGFVTSIYRKLHATIFPPRLTIYHKNERQLNLYFIHEGGVEVLSTKGETVIASLHKGRSFGELGMVFCCFLLLLLLLLWL